VYVIIESLDPEIGKGGLTTAQIRTDVELKLRLAGIKVLTEKEWLQTTGRPFLYVDIHAFKFDTSEVYIYHIGIQVYQEVVLIRAPQEEIFSATWKTWVLRKSGHIEDLRNRTKDGMDVFINTYLSVNPK